MTSLSARLLVLTIFFVMLSEVLIFAPSIARFRVTWMQERLDSAHLATLALEATPDNMVDAMLQKRLLAHSGALMIEVMRPKGSTLMLGTDMPVKADVFYDLRQPGFFGLIGDAFAALARRDDRVVRVRGFSSRDGGPVVEVLVREAPLREAMWYYAGRILALSLFISIVTAGLVYGSLHWLLIRPMRRLTASMTGFRQAPDDPSRIISPSSRSDEIGIAERALAAMQRDLRNFLAQRARLAAVGAAVTGIQHDLRGILSSAILVSERLENSDDPDVRRHAPTLVGALDRAVDLCTRTMGFVRDGTPDVAPTLLDLHRVAAEAGAIVTANGEKGRWENEVPPGLMALADRTQLLRVLENLGRNGLEAGAAKVRLAAWSSDGSIHMTIADDGPGLPAKARENLFLPFSGSSKPGGSGLGLAIARDLVMAMGGTLALDSTGPQGTVFRLDLRG